MATAEVAPDSQRAWWLRAVMVLQNPRPVFETLRDESPEAEDARAEPATALVFLGGMAAVLLTPAFGRLFDDYALDGLDVFVIVIFAGSVYGFFSYYVLGWVLSLGVRAMGAQARAKHCRHVLAFSLTPLVLSLIILWPLRSARCTAVMSFGQGDPTAGQEVSCCAGSVWRARHGRSACSSTA